MTNDELIVKVISSLPNPNLITNLDSTASASAIRFDYGGTRFRVSQSLFVEEVVGGCLACSDKADEIKKLLRG